MGAGCMAPWWPLGIFPGAQVQSLHGNPSAWRYMHSLYPQIVVTTVEVYDWGASCSNLQAPCTCRLEQGKRNSIQKQYYLALCRQETGVLIGIIIHGQKTGKGVTILLHLSRLSRLSRICLSRDRNTFVPFFCILVFYQNRSTAPAASPLTT